MRVELWQLVIGALATVLSSAGLSQMIAAVANRRKVAVESEKTVHTMTLEFAAAVTANADRAMASAAKARAEADDARADAEHARTDVEAARRDLRICRRASEDAMERMTELGLQVEQMERRMAAWKADVWHPDATVESIRALIGPPDPATSGR